MREHFIEMEKRRLLHVLRNKKANSICGERDSAYIRRLKQKPCLLNLPSLRSLSIYSEGVAFPAREDKSRREYDPKMFHWRYRVKNRGFIPDFFPDNVENLEVQRHSTPEKLTYYLPKEEQHHDI